MLDPDADAAPALEAIKRTYQPHTRRRKMKVPLIRATHRTRVFIASYMAAVFIASYIPPTRDTPHTCVYC